MNKILLAITIAIISMQIHAHPNDGIDLQCEGAAGFDGERGTKVHGYAGFYVVNETDKTQQALFTFTICPPLTPCSSKSETFTIPPHIGYAGHALGLYEHTNQTSYGSYWWPVYADLKMGDKHLKEEKKCELIITK